MAMAATSATAAARSMQPPMNDFDFAFYTCDGAGAFQVSYDSETPKTATLTTNENNKRYVLNRQPSADGVQFAGGAAKFWTDGRKVVVEGAARPLQNCRRKAN
jgi:membrane-bound inhibitor of C-type lysozyme